jgi:hypothetical protein
VSSIPNPRHDEQVRAILSNQHALKAVRYLYTDAVDPEKLSAAWAALTPDEQELWMTAYGLSGEAPRPGKQIAAGNITLRLQRWTRFGFAGMNPTVLMRLVRADVENLADLQSRINELVLEGGVGPVRFVQIQTWVTANGHPSLLAHLSPEAIDKLSIRLAP